jgi:hypothetical protein
LPSPLADAEMSESDGQVFLAQVDVFHTPVAGSGRW